MTSPYIIKENEKKHQFECKKYLLDHEFYILSTDYEWLWEKLCKTNISFVGWAVTNQKNNGFNIIATSMESVVNDIIIGTVGYTIFITNSICSNDWFIRVCQLHSLHYVVGVKQ